MKSPFEYYTRKVLTPQHRKPDPAIIVTCTLDGYSYGYPVFLVEECVFDRSRTSHLVNLFEMNAKYATVIQLSEALSYVSQLKRMEGRNASARALTK